MGKQSRSVIEIPDAVAVLVLELLILTVETGLLIVVAVAVAAVHVRPVDPKLGYRMVS